MDRDCASLCQLLPTRLAKQQGWMFLRHVIENDFGRSELSGELSAFDQKSFKGDAR